MGIKIAADAKSIEERGTRWTISPYDEFALAEAIRLKESLGGVVTVISAGPERVKTALRECLACGADEAIWLQIAHDSLLDAVSVARNLGAVYREGKYDLLWFGQKTAGWEEGLVGPMTAELLGLPHVGSVVKLEVVGNSIVCWREIEDAHERVETSLPCVLLAQKGLSEPRYPSLRGIMQAKKKVIRERTALTFPLTMNVRQLKLAPPRPPCRFVPFGDPKSSAVAVASNPAAAAHELVRILREDAKVI